MPHTLARSNSASWSEFSSLESCGRSKDSCVFVFVFCGRMERLNGCMGKRRKCMHMEASYFIVPFLPSPSKASPRTYLLSYCG